MVSRLTNRGVAMKTQDLEGMLSAHADGLNAGQDLSQALLARHPVQAEAAQPLMALAQRVGTALRPVEPRAAFVTALKAQLVAQPAAVTVSQAAPRQSRWVWVLAGVGGVLSVASAVIIVFRLAAGGAKLVGELVERRAARLPATRMRTAH